MNKKGKKKLTVALIFGGKSVEHEVSVLSAKNISEQIDKKKYTIFLIFIDKNGIWKHADSVEQAKNGKRINPFELKSKLNIDVVFPVIHGTTGEDGSIQGVLQYLEIPYVGSSILGSAIGFDKDVTKRLLKNAGIPIAQFFSYRTGEVISFTKIKKTLGLPLFVKPANAGSSVGVSKVNTKKEFIDAIAHAFLFDTKIIIEEYIDGREIECAVLGNKSLKASVLGEVITSHAFYSYEAKYKDEVGSRTQIPVLLPKAITKKIQATAVHVFQVLEAEGLARVDFFLQKNGAFVVNEINTIPGFTNISMYPQLWVQSGFSYTELISELISLSLERDSLEKKLQTSYN